MHWRAVQPADVLRTRTQMGLVQGGGSAITVLRTLIATQGVSALMTGMVRPGGGRWQGRVAAAAHCAAHARYPRHPVPTEALTAMPMVC